MGIPHSTSKTSLITPHNLSSAPNSPRGEFTSLSKARAPRHETAFETRARDTLVRSADPAGGTLDGRALSILGVSDPPLGIHELGPIGQLGRVLIVSPASKSQAGNGCISPTCELPHVIELESGTFLATPPRFAHEGALACVPPPDRAANRTRNVATRRIPVGSNTPRRFRCPELATFKLGDQHFDCARHDFGQVARWDFMAEQFSRMTQLFVGATGESYLKCIAPSRKRPRGGANYSASAQARHTLD